MKFMPTLLSAAILMGLAGCAAFPDNYESPVSQANVREEMADAWNNKPAIQVLPSAAGSSIRRFNEIPVDVANRKIKLDLVQTAHLTVGDVLYGLRAQGVRVVSKLEDGTMSEPWLSWRFEGTLGELMDRISVDYNVSMEYRRGTIFITESAKYAATMPQQKELMEVMAKAIEDMGGTGVRTDLAAGSVFYQAKPDVSEEIEEYLGSVSQNIAMVSLQIAVVTVGMNRDRALGFDWTQLMSTYGAKGMKPNGMVINGEAVASSEGGEGGSTGGGVVGNMLSMVGGDGLAIRFANNSFNLTAAIRAMSTFGNARTEQNVIMSTVSGMPVKIKSGNEIPYVKSIGSATTSGGSVSGSSETAVAESGLTVDITPYFDAKDKALVTSVGVNMSTLVGFRELKAGENLGTMSQPEMQRLEFENVGRLQAGETIVVGGISYSQETNNHTNLPGFEKAPTGSESKKVTRNSVYIVIRPTVVIYSKPEDIAKNKMGLLAPPAQTQQEVGLEAKTEGIQ